MSPTVTDSNRSKSYREKKGDGWEEGLDHGEHSILMSRAFVWEDEKVQEADGGCTVT